MVVNTISEMEYVLLPRIKNNTNHSLYLVNSEKQTGGKYIFMITLFVCIFMTYVLLVSILVVFTFISISKFKIP